MSLPSESSLRSKASLLRSMKAGQLLKEMFAQGWAPKRQSGSHLILEKVIPGGPSMTYSWSFHKNETIGKPMLAKLMRKTGLQIGA